MKKLTVLIIIMLFILIGCNDNDENEHNDENSVNDSEISDENVTELEDNEESENDSHGDDFGEDLSEWMQPEDDWESWAYLKIMGPIIGENADYEAAVFTDGKIKLTSGATDFADGNITVLSDWYSITAASYEFSDVDEDAGTAVIDYNDAYYQFPVDFFENKEDECQETTGYGAIVTFKKTFIDVKFDASGAITDQQVRKNCYLAISAMEMVEKDGKMYETPIGDIYACFCCESTGQAGEDGCFMFKNKMDDSQETLLEFYNRKVDGSDAVYGDEDFQHLCQCYDAEGKEVNCWEYDGPGGAEECPDYVPQEDCKPQENDNIVIDEDSVPDEDME